MSFYIQLLNHVNAISEIIKNRRSIFPKEYTGKKLEASIIENVLQNANFAPNHKSNYPWRFIVIEGDKLNTWLDECADIYLEETPSEKFNQEKLNKTLGYKQKISHAIAVVMHRDEKDKTIETEDICAVACGVQNMYLTLSAYPNAAGYWSTGLGTYSKRMSDFLYLDEHDTLLGYFILGHVELKRSEANKRDYHNFVRYL